jgi:hypothetical protein
MSKPIYEVQEDPNYEHAIEVFYKGERFLWWNNCAGTEYPEDMTWCRDISNVFNAGVRLGQKVSAEPMWALYGIRESKSYRREFELHESRELVAYFSSEEAAKRYVKKACLKNPIPRRGFSPAKAYRKASLLWGYSFVEIEPTHRPPAPLDPEV